MTGNTHNIFVCIPHRRARRLSIWRRVIPLCPDCKRRMKQVWVKPPHHKNYAAWNKLATELRQRARDKETQWDKRYRRT